MKIAILCPHTETIRADCARAINELIAHTLSLRITYNGAITQPRFEFFYEGAGPLEYKRTQLALRAMERSPDYLLLVDWDMVPPPDGLLRLAAHDKPFVAANYMQRHEEREPTAFKAEGVRATGSGLEQVAAAGLGFALIKPEVFSATPQPWYRTEIDDTGMLVSGEDVHFCNRVRLAGIPIFVDHELPVGHIAETVLTIEGGAIADTIRPSAGAQ